MLLANSHVPEVEVLWWALVPLLIFAVAGLLLLTVASLFRYLPGWLPTVWSAAAGLGVLFSSALLWCRVQDEGPRVYLAGAVTVEG